MKRGDETSALMLFLVRFHVRFLCVHVTEKAHEDFCKTHKTDTSKRQENLSVRKARSGAEIHHQTTTMVYSRVRHFHLELLPYIIDALCHLWFALFPSAFVFHLSPFLGHRNSVCTRGEAGAKFLPSLRAT